MRCVQCGKSVYSSGRDMPTRDGEKGSVYRINDWGKTFKWGGIVIVFTYAIILSLFWCVGAESYWIEASVFSINCGGMMWLVGEVITRRNAHGSY